MRIKVGKEIKKNIPKEVWDVFEKFAEKEFDIYLVGAGVRNLLSGKVPVDCDFTTNARPEEIRALFKNSFYDNVFGTVGIPKKTKKGKEIYEITTYRKEWGYSDKRRPDRIEWGDKLEEDLKRRDFTMNAIVIGPVLKNGKWNKKSLELIDLFGGKKDFENKIIRAVGDPKERFSEDALRMMRAARFATILKFKIEKKTAQAIKKCSHLLEAISKERIGDEFMKIIMSKKAHLGIELLRKSGLLEFIVPELLEGYGVQQPRHHIYEVYEHAILSLKYAAEQDYNKYVRLAALFHDIGKPRVKKGEGEEATFYNHEVVGAKMTREILKRLRFPKKESRKIVKLVRYHLFYYTPEEVSESSVRRLVKKVGLENMDDLLKVRYSDRIGSGCPKAVPYKLRYMQYVIEKVSQHPISVKMLKVKGDDVMRILNIQPGLKVGQVLDILLGYVLEDPKKNGKEFLEKEIKKLGKLSEDELKNLSQKARREREKIEMKREKMTKKKYWVT